LRRVGIYDAVVDVELPFPKRERTGDKAADSARYAKALAEHDAIIWPQLLSMALTLVENRPKTETTSRPSTALATESQIDEEVARRAAPETYSELWGKPLKEAASELKQLGRPLAPQSVSELDTLLRDVKIDDFDEDGFVDAEKKADAKLYRDRRLAKGIQATLEQRVADFREK
jgi:hypothetical protein